jgi:adenosyl cobinamide kinase/adenosyl cobinamide phosphate guanylyltransferase
MSNPNPKYLVVLPMVSVRFAEELIRLCKDELEYTVTGTIYDNDLQSFVKGVMDNVRKT